MKFLDLASKRQSVRFYSDKKVDREDIITCIKAASLAPSACNAQPWKFVVVDEPELLDKVRKNVYDSIIGMNRFVLEAPALIVVVGEKRNLTSSIGEIVKKKDFTSMDVGMAVEHFCLQATELSLGTCIIGWFKNKEIKKLLNIPSNKNIELVISLGYFDNIIRDKKRKPFEDIYTFNKYL